MGLQKKYLIAQDGATEFDYHKEHLPLAEDVGVTVSTANTLVGDDLQDILNKMARPTVSQVPVYLGNGDIDLITFYKNSTQTTPNRIAVMQLTYASGLPSTETWTIYSDTDGTTVLKTFARTYTWTSGNLTNVTSSTT